jgi:hypothetical protein
MSVGNNMDESERSQTQSNVFFKIQLKDEGKKPHSNKDQNSATKEGILL